MSGHQGPQSRMSPWFSLAELDSTPIRIVVHPNGNAVIPYSEPLGAGTGSMAGALGDSWAVHVLRQLCDTNQEHRILCSPEGPPLFQPSIKHICTIAPLSQVP